MIMTHTTSSNNNTKPFFWVDKLHQASPKLAAKVSLAACGGAIATQSLAVGVPLFGFGAAKLLGQKLPAFDRLGKKADNHIIDIADRWITINNYLIDKLLPSKDWQITLPDGLDLNKKYLLICNHQSWVDTSIIQYISQGKLPLTRFFAKHELLYIPVVGQAFYLLDFPMMKRPSKEALANNPKLAGRDLQEARRACQMLIDKPFVLLNYLEGTRFSTGKHKAQNSPYRHLLKPKAGGFALALSSLGSEIDGVLDMTIVYPDGVPTYDELWAGKVRRLGVDIRPANLPDALLDALKAGEYSTNDTIKDELYGWLDALWQAKDARIDEMLTKFA